MIKGLHCRSSGFLPGGGPHASPNSVAPNPLCLPYRCSNSSQCISRGGADIGIQEGGPETGPLTGKPVGIALVFFTFIFHYILSILRDLIRDSF